MAVKNIYISHIGIQYSESRSTIKEISGKLRTPLTAAEYYKLVTLRFGVKKGDGS